MTLMGSRATERPTAFASTTRCTAAETWCECSTLSHLILSALHGCRRQAGTFSSVPTRSELSIRGIQMKEPRLSVWAADNSDVMAEFQLTYGHVLFRGHSVHSWPVNLFTTLGLRKASYS